ncbi:MAG TPA: dipeptidase [Chitinophagaceae bacterium]|nr:dipeptidase [Chitinophagaceae bacterium]
MRYLILFFLLLTSIFINAQSARKIHFKAVLVDTHNDVLSESVLEGKDISHRLNSGQSDLDRFREGGVDVQFFSVWTGEKARNKEGFFKDANQEIDSLEFIILRNPDRMMPGYNFHDVKRGIRQKKLVALIGVEGGHMIEDDLNKLDSLYKRGMRYMTLTWNNSNSWATSAMDETEHPDSLPHKGLTGFGKKVIKRMNELGVIVDLSHTGEQTFYDAIAATTKPVLLSHSSVWNICPVFRNVKDDQIRAVAKNGGVICVNFYSGFISKEYDQRSSWLSGAGKKISEDSLWNIYHDSAIVKNKFEDYRNEELNKVRPTISQLVDHIDYIVKLVGDDYVGIGSDFDGVSSLPIGMDDVTKYPLITEELRKRGYSKKSIKKILGGNVLRVMKANFN